jgi:hypothetical protein
MFELKCIQVSERTKTRSFHQYCLDVQFSYLVVGGLRIVSLQLMAGERSVALTVRGNKKYAVAIR